jgi:hypothetical protein
MFTNRRPEQQKGYQKLYQQNQQGKKGENNTDNKICPNLDEDGFPYIGSKIEVIFFFFVFFLACYVLFCFKGRGSYLCVR